MIKGLGLYLFSFALLALAGWQSSLAWMAPVALAILLFGSLLLWRAEGRPLRDLGFRRIAYLGRFFSIGFLIGATIPIIVLLLIWAAGWADISVRIEAWRVLIIGISIALIRAALIAASEELVFRGYFLRIFDLQFGFNLAVLGSSLLWALTHLTDMIASGLSPISIVIGMGTFIIWGVVLALSVKMGDDSLWIPYGIHFGYNLVFSIFGYFLAISLDAPQWVVGHVTWSPESGLLGFAIWIGALLILWGIRARGNYVGKQTTG